MSAVLRLPVSVAPRLQNAFEQFLAETRLRGLSHTTLTWYVVTLGPFLRHALAAGCERTDDVQLTHVRAFLADRQPSVAAGRINQYRKVIRRFFDWAVAEVYAADNPAARIRKLREARTLISTFSERDLHTLLAQPDPKTFIGSRDLTFMLLLLDTGVRLSEALGLRLNDLDFDALTLTVMGKGSKERLVGCSPAFAGRVQDYLTKRAEALASIGLAECPWVFVNQFGTRAHGRTFQDQLKRYGKRAGITRVRVSPHSFRHTFAVWFVRHGGSPFHLQKCLGHADLQMTRRYCELADVDFLSKQRELSPVTTLNLDPRQRRCLR